MSQVAGYDYVDFIGTGIVAPAVLFSSAFPGMFATFVKRKFQRTYDAVLAAPVDTEELVTAEALWVGLKADVYGTVPMLVAVTFGLAPSLGMLLVPFIGILTGIGFALFGTWVSGVVPSIDVRARHLGHPDAAVPGGRHVLAGRRAARGGRPPGGAQPAVPLRRAAEGRRLRLLRSARPRVRGRAARLRRVDVAVAVHRLRSRLVD